MRPASDIASARSGFVLPVVLGLIVIAGLVAVHAATDLGTHSSLATMRLLHQRAFEAGESGVAAVVAQMPAGDPPATQHFTSPALVTDHAQVSFTRVATLALPTGFSAGRVREVHDEIRSEGQSARNTRVVIVQGTRRLSSVPAP